MLLLGPPRKAFQVPYEAKAAGGGRAANSGESAAASQGPNLEASSKPDLDGPFGLKRPLMYPLLGS